MPTNLSLLVEAKSQLTPIQKRDRKQLPYRPQMPMPQERVVPSARKALLPSDSSSFESCGVPSFCKGELPPILAAAASALTPGLCPEQRPEPLPTVDVVPVLGGDETESDSAEVH